MYMVKGMYSQIENDTHDTHSSGYPFFEERKTRSLDDLSKNRLNVVNSSFLHSSVRVL